MGRYTIRNWRFRIVALVLLALLGAGWVIMLKRSANPGAASRTERFVTAPHAFPDQDTLRRFHAIEMERAEWDRSIWANEKMAQQHEERIIELWDRLRQGENPYLLARALPLDSVHLGTPGREIGLEHGIVRGELGDPPRILDRAAWHAWLEELEREGWSLEQSEWRHAAFEPGPDGARSTVVVTWHVARPARVERAVVRGELQIHWHEPADLEGLPIPATIKAIDLEWLRRTGETPFEPPVIQNITPAGATAHTDPLLILYDLSGNGFSDIILAARNLIYWNHGGGQFQRTALCHHPPSAILTAVIADFTGDGSPDFLCADFEGLMLYSSNDQGRFDTPGRRAWHAPVELMNPFVMTAGDIDGDGRLDIWLAQYKLPYVAGQMPTPYYDANDGFASFLLVNDGSGRFLDQTEAAGLSPKRHRRTYSASFVDLQGNGHLDLIVVSDFAGVDIHQNDGTGRFSDVTASVLDNPHSFGMAHTIGDYDHDGRLDLLVIGMNSFTGERLTAMDLGPASYPRHQLMRPKMAFGNRFYFQRGPRFEENEVGAQVARSGWSWGVTSFDFDNDGDLDLYIANGHKSRASARDYETQFWCHDLYIGDSTHDPAVDLFFQATGTRLYGAGWSHGGHELNRLYVNQSGSGFYETGFLFGVSMLRDSRNVVSDDLDGDGRLDLVVVTFEEWPEPRQELHLIRNRTDAGNWIGFRLRESGGGASPVGAIVAIESDRGSQTRWLVTGDSYRSQHAPTAHFGLGADTAVARAEIRWPNGRRQRLEQPAINQYHTIRWEPPASN